MHIDPQVVMAFCAMGGLGLTTIGMLIHAAVRGARIETKLDTVLEVQDDHEERLRSVEMKTYQARRT